MDTDSTIDHLRSQISATESQLRALKLQLQQAEQAALAARQLHSAYQGGFPAEWIEEAIGALNPHTVSDIAQKLRQDGVFEGAPTPQTPGSLPSESEKPRRWPLEDEEYRRYGRQMIMPEIGLHGQLRLKQAKVLVVGVGGLGCPAAAYLAGAGVGALGLIDGDTVEVSNLHRQVIHSTRTVGKMKVDSAIAYLEAYVRSLPPKLSTPSDALLTASILMCNMSLIACISQPSKQFLPSPNMTWF
jgi:adenylyltransferase and sulfurtransferase